MENTQASALRLRWNHFKNAVPSEKREHGPNHLSVCRCKKACAVYVSMLDKGREMPAGLACQGWNYRAFESVFCYCNEVLETGSSQRKELSGLMIPLLYSTNSGFVLCQPVRKGRRQVLGGGGNQTELLCSNHLWWSLIQSWKNSINSPSLPDLQRSPSSCSIWHQQPKFNRSSGGGGGSHSNQHEAQGISSYLHTLLRIFLHSDA